MNKLLLPSIIAIFALPVFADNETPSYITNSSGCNQGVLQTDTGPAALEANYSANTINTTWYSDGVQLEVDNAATSCTYDTAMTLPTNPTKAGYEFTGWKIKRCEIPSADVSTNPYRTASLRLSNGSFIGEGGVATYGITEPGEWGVLWENGDKATGVALCSVRSGNNYRYHWGGNSSDWTSDETTLTSASGSYCWCKVTHYTANGGDQCALLSSVWVFLHQESNQGSCLEACAVNCVIYIRQSNDFRVAVFTGLVKQ